LRKFLTIEHVPRITDFCICIYVFGCKLSLFRLCDSDFIIIIIIIIITMIIITWNIIEYIIKRTAQSIKNNHLSLTSVIHSSTSTRSSTAGCISWYTSMENAVQMCVHRVKSTILSIKCESIKIVIKFVKFCLMVRILNIIINFNRQYCILTLHMHIWTIKTGSLHKYLSICNPYPANVENMVSS
jgi:hypothetical protein